MQMALHRDIYWVGRQWAVTGYGLQAWSQKQKGKFDIEAARLWEDDVLERMRALSWLNIEDFEKALSVARKHYPDPPRRPRFPRSLFAANVHLSPPDPAKPVVPTFEDRREFLRLWRVGSASAVAEGGISGKCERFPSRQNVERLRGDHAQSERSIMIQSDSIMIYRIDSEWRTIAIGRT